MAAPKKAAPKKKRLSSQLFRKQERKEIPIVELKSVGKTYTQTAVPVKALQGITLSVPRGEMLAVMGPSGSGKSTLLNVIGMLDDPDTGSITVDGQDLAELKRRQLPRFRQKEIGHIFQQKNLIPTLTAFENVFLPFRYAGGKRSIKREQAEEALRLVDMYERRDHMPSQLSGGEQQRVAIARSLVLNPAVILADEPTGELDSKTGHAVMELMHSLNDKTGQTFIIVTHNEMVGESCNRIIQMQDGKIVDTKKGKKRSR